MLENMVLNTGFCASFSNVIQVDVKAFKSRDLHMLAVHILPNLRMGAFSPGRHATFPPCACVLSPTPYKDIGPIT